MRDRKGKRMRGGGIKGYETRRVGGWKRIGRDILEERAAGGDIR